MRTALAAAVLAATLAGCASSGPPSGPAENLAGLPPDVPTLSRADWNAAPPAGPMTPHVPDRITVHHTATPADPGRPNADKLRGLQAFSQRADTLGDGRPKAAWADVPYHYYVAHDGTVVEGRDVRFEGDTNTRYDLTGHVQVVVEGNFEEAEPTPAQLRSLTALVSALVSRFDVPPEAVAGHGDRAEGQTLCPGEALEAFLPDLRTAVAEPRR